MSLNIKNEQTHALVRELASVTGLSQTGAVEDAVRRRLAELQAAGGPDAGRLAQIRRISAAFSSDLTTAQREGLRGGQDDLYDELGLPA